MSRTGGEITRARILEAAERLFADKGYSETSVGDIAKSAGVNKALIYYYFTSKDELLQTLLKGALAEIEVAVKYDPQNITEETIQKELRLIGSRKNILTILLRESLRNGKVSDFLLGICENEAKPLLTKTDSKDRNRVLTLDAFTGAIPYMMFLVLEDKWCEYFKCSREQAEKDFARLIIDMHMECCKKLIQK